MIRPRDGPRFQRSNGKWLVSWGVAPGWYKSAPLALNRNLGASTDSGRDAPRTRRRGRLRYPGATARSVHVDELLHVEEHVAEVGPDLFVAFGAGEVGAVGGGLVGGEAEGVGEFRGAGG